MPPSKEELRRGKLAKLEFLKKKGVLQGPNIMKRRSSISQIAKRMSASPPSMYGSALEPAKPCNRRKKPAQITTSKPFEEHSKKDGSGMIANPSQAIPLLTSFTCIDDATVSVSESPAIKLEDDISIPPGAGSKQKLKKNRRRRKHTMKTTAEAIGVSTLLDRPLDSGFVRSSEEQTTSRTEEHDPGKKGCIECESEKGSKIERSGTQSEPTQNVPTLTRSTNQKGAPDEYCTPGAFAETGVAILTHAESVTVKPEVHSMLPIVSSEPNFAVKNRGTWSIIHSLPLEEVAKFVVNHEFGFRLKTENTPSKGRMRYYNCAKIKVRAKPQCARQLLVFIPDTTGAVTISARGKHTCQDASVQNMARSRITIQHKELIDHLVGSGLPSKDVKTHLKLTDGNITKGALNYAVKTSKEKLFGSGKLSLGELEQWVASKSVVPDDAHEAFVIGSDIDHENGKFRFVISSKRLLLLLPRFKTVAADCTFKTTLQGYPLLVVCVIDEMRKAHPIAFACISNQEQTDYRLVFQSLHVAVSKLGVEVNVTSFLSDGELALKNAARYVFGQSVILLNCYFHVKENLTKHFKKSTEMPQEVQEQVMREITKLQVAPTKQHFTVALELFVEKYKMYEAFSQFFSKYARNEKFAMWYEAAQPGVPATNNALEAINKSIKYNYLKRHREPLGTFKVQMMNIIQAYSSPDREIAMERSVNLADERKAFDILKGPKKLRTVNKNHAQNVYIPGKGKTEVSSMDITRFENPVYSNLEAYAEEHGHIHRVQLNSGRFSTWTCTCTHFFKTNGCAHILVVAVKRNCYTLRPEANTALLSTKKSGGRPKFVSKALCIE